MQGLAPARTRTAVHLSLSFGEFVIIQRGKFRIWLHYLITSATPLLDSGTLS